MAIYTSAFTEWVRARTALGRRVAKVQIYSDRVQKEKREKKVWRAHSESLRLVAKTRYK